MTVHELGPMVCHLIQARRTTLPKRLKEPGPTPRELQLLFESAAAAPDHDQIVPWRFTVVDLSARPSLAEVFAESLRQRDPKATLGELERAREKAYRAPLLMLLTVDTGAHLGNIADRERYISAGCAVQNLLLHSEAMGYASSLTSGKAMDARPLRDLFGLSMSEVAVCFINLGTSTECRPRRPRPDPSMFVRHLRCT